MPDKNKYLLFSGISHTRYADVFTLSTDDWTWNEINCSGEIPKELSYCVGWYDCKYYLLKLIPI
jgi:hypothetical protein